MGLRITPEDLLGGGKNIPWRQRVAQIATEAMNEPPHDNSLSYGELRQFQAVGNTDSPTNQMVPNIVAPDKQNPALTGIMPQSKVGTNGGGKAATQGTVDSYDKMLEFLKARQQVDADADKRARRREMMAAIGDGISALSSLYQTTKGAPVTYAPGHDMSEVMRQRYDRYIAQRKADEDKYLNYLKVQHAAEQDKESQEYRRQMAEYRQQQIEETERTHKANEELKREQLEAKKTAEENIRAYRQARLDMMRAKDPGTVEFFKAKAEALANGWPESEANEAGQIAQERYNEAKKEADRQKKLADKKAIKAAPNPPRQGKKKTSRKSSSGSSGNGSLGHAPGNL
jgi:hypothetical protein